MTIVFTLQELKLSWKKVAANKGIAGVDGQTIAGFENQLEQNLAALLAAWNRKAFRPSPYRQVVLEKPDKKPRTLSIPTVSDRIIHTALAQRFASQFEAEFESISYGYRPNRSYTHAIRHIEQLRNQGYQYVLDADIKGYFEHIDHRVLRHLLDQYLPAQEAGQILSVLLSQQMNDGVVSFGDREGVGIPQGSPLSPLLANLYLDGFDEALLDRGEHIIRYADDFVVLLKDQKSSAQCLSFVTHFLAQLGLELNEDKTRVVTFQDGFTFLGVTFLDNMILPLKAHTEKALVGMGKHELELSEDDAAFVRASEDDELNHILWHSSLPPALRTLQAQIYDDDSALPLEPDASRIERLALNHIARLKLVYIHKQGAAVHKLGNRLNVFHDGKRINSLPANTLDMLLCFGAVHLTQAVQRFCLENDITVIWLTQSGQYLGCLSAPFQGDPELTKAQVLSREEPAVRRQMARFFIRSKINNCLGVMRRQGKKRHRDKQAEKHLVSLRDKLDGQSTIAAMRGTEGAAARSYFQWYRSLFSPDWGFNCRNRQPPKDPVNAMLSYGYTLLFHNIRALTEARGLLPHLGYLHGSQPGQPSLVLDLMEGFRPWLVDELVINLVDKGVISTQEFTTNSSGTWLTKKARRTFIQTMEQKLLAQHSHPTLKIKTDVRRLMDIQILELRHQLLSGSWTLTPQRIR